MEGLEDEFDLLVDLGVRGVLRDGLRDDLAKTVTKPHAQAMHGDFDGSPGHAEGSGNVLVGEFHLGSPEDLTELFEQVVLTRPDIVQADLFEGLLEDAHGPPTFEQGFGGFVDGGFAGEEMFLPIAIEREMHGAGSPFDAGGSPPLIHEEMFEAGEEE